MTGDNVFLPQIEPSHFDLIVVGTGLPESIIAAAASAVGKTVLHLDPNSFYGGEFSSLSLDEFTSFLQPGKESKEDSPFSENGSSDYVEAELKTESLYSDVEISLLGSSEDLGNSRKFSLDLSGPRVLFCAEPSVNLMLKSGASNHVEFKSIDATYIYGNDGKLSTVPDSRSAIFKDKSLGLIEKNKLMKFFKLVQEHIGFDEKTKDQSKRISDEDLEIPFIDFLTKQQLPPNIKTIILYAIAMADYDQDRPEECKNRMKTKDGIETLSLYHASVGRFTNALGALIYPVYGQGELPQAFCRVAAVKGALYVLRMPVREVLFDKESREYKGLKLSSGQEVFSNQLVMGSSFSVPSQSVLQSLPELSHKVSEGSSEKDVIGQVARAVCITRASIVPGLSNLLVIFPPKCKKSHLRFLCYPSPKVRYLHDYISSSFISHTMTSVRALQLCSNVAVCPQNSFIWYLSTLCDDATQGKESLRAAINALETCSASKSIEENEEVQNKNENTEASPNVLWSALYIQQLTTVTLDAISVCSTPDGNLDYRDMLESTETLFHMLYPTEEFMPQTNAPEGIADEEIEAE